MVEIRTADFDDDALLAFLRQHVEDIAPTAPAESQHALDSSALAGPGVRLWVAYVRDRVVGTVALAALTGGHEELKSMRTDPDHRGAGIGQQLLECALADAVSRGVERISLETGSMEFFAAARRLYTRNGFAECAPFGSYIPDENSTFMTKQLA